MLEAALLSENDATVLAEIHAALAQLRLIATFPKAGSFREGFYIIEKTLPRWSYQL